MTLSLINISKHILKQELQEQVKIERTTPLDNTRNTTDIQ